MKFMKLSYILISLFVTNNLSHAITIRTDTVSHDRFNNTTPGALENASFKYSSQQFSGVGWDDTDTRKSITMISDRHFLAASHFAVPIGNTVHFRDNNGLVLDYMVSAITSISNADNSLSGNSDLIIGTLSSAVSSDVNFYPLLDPTLTPVGQNILIYGQKGKVGESTIVSHQDASVRLTPTATPVEGRSSVSQYIIAAGGGDDAFFTNGDSGGPSFIVGQAGELIVSGVHWAVGSDEITDPIAIPAKNRFNFDTHASDYINQINMINGLTVTTSSNIIPVPEPSSALLIAISSLTLIMRRKKKITF